MENDEEGRSAGDVGPFALTQERQFQMKSVDE